MGQQHTLHIRDTGMRAQGGEEEVQEWKGSVGCMWVGVDACMHEGVLWACCQPNIWEGHRQGSSLASFRSVPRHPMFTVHLYRSWLAGSFFGGGGCELNQDKFIYFSFYSLSISSVIRPSATTNSKLYFASTRENFLSLLRLHDFLTALYHHPEQC